MQSIRVAGNWREEGSVDRMESATIPPRLITLNMTGVFGPPNAGQTGKDGSGRAVLVRFLL